MWLSRLVVLGRERCVAPVVPRSSPAVAVAAECASSLKAPPRSNQSKTQRKAAVFIDHPASYAKRLVLDRQKRQETRIESLGSTLFLDAQPASPIPKHDLIEPSNTTARLDVPRNAGGARSSAHKRKKREKRRLALVVSLFVRALRLSTT